MIKLSAFAGHPTGRRVMARLRSAVRSKACRATAVAASQPAIGADLYLDLMRRSLTGWTHAGEDLRSDSDFASRPGRLFARRPEGWPEYIHTMVGFQRLGNVQFCVDSVLQDHVPGDLLEAGVWRGGAAIFMRAVLEARGETDRAVWLADAFEGVFPEAKAPQDEKYREVKRPDLGVPVEEVRANFEGYGLLDERVRFLEGWFSETLPSAPVERLAVLRLDGDMYESTMDSLNHLYPKLSVGGYVIVDDYGALEPCRQAVHDYRNAQGITEEIVPIDWTGVYWRRAS